MDLAITKITARQILDSRGNPTVECDVYTKSSFGRASVPSGASTGRHEAVELRDGGPRYGGKGVKSAIKNIGLISKHIIGKDCTRQDEIDDSMIALDATKNKSFLGANATLAVSLAVSRAAASALNVPLYNYLAKLAGTRALLIPTPFCNVINGGRHANGALKLQEIMIVPSNYRTFSDAIAAVCETYAQLKSILAKKNYSTTVGDEGGFAPKLSSADEAFTLLEDAIIVAGHRRKISFAIDAAASEFYDKKSRKYILEKSYSQGELEDYYLSLIRKFDIISIEDPFEEDDFSSFASLRKKSNIQIVGDDLLVTNTARIKAAIKRKSCNCLLLKVNQIGTLTEAIAAANMAKKAGWNVMVSHRSGETCDSFISDLAVALGCGQIKSGAPARAERTSKYNQLLRIEQESKLRFASI